MTRSAAAVIECSTRATTPVERIAWTATVQAPSTATSQPTVDQDDGVRSWSSAGRQVLVCRAGERPRQRSAFLRDPRP